MVSQTTDVSGAAKTLDQAVKVRVTALGGAQRIRSVSTRLVICRYDTNSAADSITTTFTYDVRTDDAPYDVDVAAWFNKNDTHCPPIYWKLSSYNDFANSALPTLATGFTTDQSSQFSIPEGTTTLRTVALVEGTYTIYVSSSSVSLNTVTSIKVTITVQCGANSNQVNTKIGPNTITYPRVIAEESGANPTYNLVNAGTTYLKTTVFSLEYNNNCGWSTFTYTKTDGNDLDANFNSRFIIEDGDLVKIN
jgi:hypothetical protein